MALQQINWTQINTETVPSGSVIDLGAISGALHAVYAENLYVSGLSLTDFIEQSGTAELNIYSASLKAAIETTGSNLTVKGNLLVKGTTTAINSTTVAIGDNVIELNGTEAVNGGLLIKDPTNPNRISGSLLWDTTNDYWIAGPLGSEEKIIRQTDYTTLSSSLSASINTLSGSLSGSISQLSSSLSSSIDTLSGSLSASISQLSSSLSSSIDSLSGSLSGSISELSSSVSNSLHDLRTDLEATNIWQQTGSFYGANENLQVTGSIGSLLNSPDGAVTNKYAFEVSQSIHAENINVGYPTSNLWQQNLNGSYFNNFNHNTDVSEILRFVAGLLSSSAPDASPNTKGYSGYTKNSVNTTTGTALAGYIPQSSTNTTITYLNSKGFANVGAPIFSGITPVYTDITYGHTYTSVASGTTIVSSSVDSQLFGLGLLSSGNPTSFKVSGSFIFKFKDNSSKTDTATSSSNHLVTQTGAGTTSGVSLAKILTVNPNVIPPAYQDGKFASTFSPSLYNAGATAVSGSGYYHITGSISIASGSSVYTTPITTTTEIFYAPLSTISTNVGTNTIATGSTTITGTTATSRSLSGAPYLTSATHTISSSVSGIFNPLYANNSAVANIGNDGGYYSITSGNYNATIGSNGTISSSNTMFDSTGTTVRITGTVPYETDIAKINGIQTFTPTNATNIGQSSISPTTFGIYINGRNFNNSLTQRTNTVNIHTAGSFGQPADSGSLAYYGRAQGADTSTALVESFTGESNRLVLNDNILSFTGTAWDTTFGLYNLGTKDLQVKPGYLVKPGGTYGYWLTNPSSASDYKYYIRKFSTSGTKTSMTLNMGKSLVAWDASTSNSIGAVILFESSKSGVYTPPRFYDPTKTLSNFVSTISANTDGQNPFGSSIDLYGNTGGSVSSTTYTIPIRNADGMFLNATYDEIYVIVRYKGDPAPITGITVAFS